METKHTKEYAEKVANLSLPIRMTDSHVRHNKIQHNRKYFIKGYMEAIKQTAALELLEALIEFPEVDPYETYEEYVWEIEKWNKKFRIKVIKKATE